jgi:hypothetical protein
MVNQIRILKSWANVSDSQLAFQKCLLSVIIIYLEPNGSQVLGNLAFTESILRTNLTVLVRVDTQSVIALVMN